MKPKSIGIVGGAGPLAGVLLLKRILSLSQDLYQCSKDSDFPKVLFINFPFSEMLKGPDPIQIKQELSDCLTLLRKNGAHLIAIACNTLHAFLDENQEDIISFPKAVTEEISNGEKPLVLCTSTSAKARLHNQFFDCIYPSRAIQEKIDGIIDLILKGEDGLIPLTTLLGEVSHQVIILGCTELSLLTKHLDFVDKTIIDPLEIVAKKLITKAFQN